MMNSLNVRVHVPRRGMHRRTAHGVYGWNAMYGLHVFTALAKVERAKTAQTQVDDASPKLITFTLGKRSEVLRCLGLGS